MRDITLIENKSKKLASLKKKVLRLSYHTSETFNIIVFNLLYI